MASTARRFELSDQDYIKAFEEAQGSFAKACEIVGVDPNAMRTRFKRMKREKTYDWEMVRARFRGEQRREFVVAPLPDEEISTDELLLQRKKQFSKRRAYEDAVKLIGVRVNMTGPIAILHFGDPHLDDDGTDVEAVENHCQIIRETPGLFAACVGDLTNNWIGRLARLYAEQSTSAKQAWQLAEWYVQQLRGKWLYLIGGNHDAWSGQGDPLKWITRQNDALYKASECRLELRLPNGQKPRINARHDFSGHSMWNPAHGPMKALTMGVRDHVAIAGHKHESAYSLLKCPETGITMHAIKVSTYKTFDRYAKERGFRDQTLSPCAVTVFNTAIEDTHPDYVKVFWEPAEGAEYLTFLRSRK
jgi:hypothetical protein